VTCLASCRKACGSMRGIVRPVVVALMATAASGVGARQAVVSVDVALLALERGVGPSESEAGCRMIERTVAPRSRVVAILAGRREACGKVRRIRRAVEIILMTTDAGRVGACQVVVPVKVALRTLQGSMCAGEREPCR